MANAAQLKALVKSHIERDDQHFFSVAMQVAAREAKAGHGKGLPSCVRYSTEAGRSLTAVTCIYA